MTNLLRKFANLFVEFDDEGKSAQASPGDAPAGGRSSGEDVLAAIEKIRTDLESEGHTNFDEPEDVLDPGLLASHRDPAGKAKPDAMKINIPDPAKGAAAKPSAPSGALMDDAGSINVPNVLSIPEVYTRAQIVDSPASVDNVDHMLNDPELEGLAMDIRARSVKMALKASGIGLEAIIADAGRRDQALEDYRFYLDRKLERIEQHVSEENQRLQAELDEIVRQKQAQMESNKQSLESARRVCAEFQTAKQAEEKRLYNIVSPFVSPGDNPVELT